VLSPHIIDQIKRHEGFSPEVYRCSAGARTIGYGHNLDAHPVPGITDGTRINENQAHRLLVADAERVERELRGLPQYVALRGQGEDVRADVLIDMAYNLGLPRLRTFRMMLSAIDRQDWDAAAAEMLHSKWARQVKTRATRLALQMRDGEVR
jgi:lysozyme